MLDSTTGSDVPRLVARDLWKRYGRGPWALEGVSLEIGPGRVTALVGPNAAGKSTLIKTWMGFERPTRGTVQVLGLDPIRRRDNVSAHLAYLPQKLALYRDLTVDDHIDLAAWLRPGFDTAVARHWVAQLAIPLGSRTSRLSGGQGAQVALAIALGSRADIFLLDEPLASLDPLARSEFLDVLRSAVSEAGSTALLSSHVVRDIEQSSDWLVVLGHGEVVLDVSVKEALDEHLVTADRSVLDERLTVVAPLPRESSVVVRRVGDAFPIDGARPATLEEVVLAYLYRTRGGIEPQPLLRPP